MNAAKINMTINGIPLTANPGQTILDVARDNNILIPTLCHDDRIEPFGSCLLCRVEVEGARGNMLACATPVTDGMVVRTESAGIASSRKMCLELLLSKHHGDCKAPCSMTCPAQVDIQGYIALIANGQYREAIKLIKERNPLPSVCGRVCTRPCEDECRRNLVDERVGIDYLKRFVSDVDLNSEQPYMPEKKHETGKKVAVIGAGPAGLSCAHYLATMGHGVTIFEKWPEGGGMLRYGIPEYRLPREQLSKEIKLIEKLGVEIKYNTVFGKDITYADLKEMGYEALFLGVGSQVGQALGLENENLDGVMSGIEFLGKVNSKEALDLTDKKVIVVGGGNTAIDAARTALRLNSKEVVLAYRRTKAEMPAHEMEIEEAEYEGVILELLAAPKRIVLDGGVLSGVEFTRMRLGEPDARGRRRPEEIPGSEFIMEADLLIGAIGQTQDLSFLGAELPVDANKNRIIVNDDFMTTNIEGVFAGGDVVTGPDCAISAIAAGRKAAYAIDDYINGRELAKSPAFYNHTKGKLKEIDLSEFKDFEKISKERMQMLPREARVGNFKEVELGFDEEQARKEAMRCLSCGCRDVNECKLRDYASTYGVQQNRFKGTNVLLSIDDSHKFITRDPNKCIMCGRCVRICMEQQGSGALGFMDRGYGTEITSSFGMPFGEDKRCESCGQCVSTCPVGALTEKSKLAKQGPFTERVTKTVCSGCGTGCSINIHTAGELIVRNTAEVGKGINNGNLCEKGRFGIINNEPAEQMGLPFIKYDGQVKYVSYNEAFKFISSQLGKTIRDFGNDSIGVFVSPNMTNEELELSEKLASHTIKTKNIGSLKLSKASMELKSSTGAAFGTADYESILNADFIMCIGFDIKEKNPVAALKIKKASEMGSKVVIIDSRESKLARFASENLVLSREEVITVLDMAEGKLQEEYKNAKNPLIIISDDTDGGIVKAVGRFVSNDREFSDKILLMHNYCNMRGMIERGANADITCSEELKAAVIFDVDDNNTLEKVPFKIVCNSSKGAAANADVFIPMSGHAFVRGTIKNSEGRLQQLENAFKPNSGLSNTEIIEAMIEHLGKFEE